MITAGGHVKSNLPEVEFIEDGGTVTAILGEGAAHIEATVGGSAVDPVMRLNSAQISAKTSISTSILVHLTSWKTWVR